MRYLTHLPRIAAAIILLQTLYFKFSGAPESVHIFSTLGVEPWGRLASGVAELVAAILLLTTRWNWLGAALAIGIMLGALGAHLTVLGIEVQGDGGLLFALALGVLLLATFVLVRSRTVAMEDVKQWTGR
ncbi:MAG: DoxX family protein [Flavobacteriales bacterium]|nr:DoxX family protein [Flavobacteriales bacterium]MBK9512744.1 DoxX family protein [Flavobacteriales bacterium]MBP7449062.1 DoxX family protein [Flavobacteriales bacterium]